MTHYQLKQCHLASQGNLFDLWPALCVELNNLPVTYTHCSSKVYEMNAYFPCQTLKYFRVWCPVFLTLPFSSLSLVHPTSWVLPLLTILIICHYFLHMFSLRQAVHQSRHLFRMVSNLFLSDTKNWISCISALRWA